MRKQSSKMEIKQRLLRHYKRETGVTEIDMHEVAKWAANKGFPSPQPPDPLEMLAKQFADAARNEIAHDPDNGRPYRVYHAVPQGGRSNLHLYGDINEAPRDFMDKALKRRRELMVGDGLQLTLDSMYWNKRNPHEEPIQLSMDFGPDVEWRLNAPDNDAEAS